MYEQFHQSGYYTPSEFARRLGLRSAETVRQMCAAGKIPGAFRISDGGRGRWRIPMQAEAAFVKERQKAERQAQTPVLDDGWDRVQLLRRVRRECTDKARKEKLIRDLAFGRRPCAAIRAELGWS